MRVVRLEIRLFVRGKEKKRIKNEGSIMKIGRA